MTVYKVGPWRQASRILRTSPDRLQRAFEQATLQEAHFFRAKVIEGFRTQAPGGKRWKPLAPTTLKLRRFQGFGGTKALIVRGDLRNSIQVHKMGRFGAMVGVLRGARGKDGQPLVNVAAVHEFGAGPILIRITPKMIRFLAAAGVLDGSGEGSGGGGGIGVIIVNIPARPFMRPVRDRYFKPSVVRDRYLTRVARLMGGDLGGVGGGSSGSGGGSGGLRGSGGSGGSGGRSGGGGPLRDPVTGRFVSRSG